MGLYRLAPIGAAPAPATQPTTYATSLTDAQWALLAPLLACPASPRGGRPPKHGLRPIVDAIRYLVSTGCAWWLPPAELPTTGTVPTTLNQRLRVAESTADWFSGGRRRG
jgi:transposase